MNGEGLSKERRYNSCGVQSGLPPQAYTQFLPAAAKRELRVFITEEHKRLFDLPLLHAHTHTNKRLGRKYRRKKVHLFSFHQACATLHTLISKCKVYTNQVKTNKQDSLERVSIGLWS